MRFDPTLIVTRMVVERNGDHVYDEKFHEGVNVIRGENSSGKSTVLNLIYYGLGGDLSDWSETALLCNRVVVEVKLNGKIATLSREISDKSGQPMQIFGGPYDESTEAPRGDWITYPYKRSQSRESFSQALFRLLGLPEVANEVSGNLTIHQLLRLLYADQLSPVEDIFRFERFDQAPLRDAIGRLLSGAYESSIYANEIQIKKLDRTFDEVSAELRSLFAVIGKTDQSITLDWFAAALRKLEQDRDNLQKEIEIAERALFASAKDDNITLAAQNEAYSSVQHVQSALVSARQDLDELTLTMADSASFIRGLTGKVTALNDALLVSEQVEDIRFYSCPACQAPVQNAEADAVVSCHLCKTPFNAERAQSRMVSMLNAAAIQLKQSQQLQSERESRQRGLVEKIERLKEEWRAASRRLDGLKRTPSSEARDNLRDLHKKSGYLDREIEDVTEKMRLAHLVDELSKRKTDLNSAISKLRVENEKLRAEQQNRLSKAYSAIADEVRDLLRNDLRRQDSFENPQKISINFEGNKISVDGHAYFSASSRVVLKSSFFLGFFAAATKDRQFRHPRFCMIDTIEDKGMEIERSHNFQNLVLKKSQEAKVEHQIIYATAMISPQLDEPEYTVGKFSTRDDPTLNLSGIS